MSKNKKSSSQEDWQTKLLSNKEKIVGQGNKIVEENTNSSSSSYSAINVALDEFNVNHVSPITSPERKAWAPYNFISLNGKIIPSAFSIKENPFDKYYDSKVTGYIKVKIETMTPIYIRDTIDSNEYATAKESKDIYDFFSPGDHNILKIPGSSQRGLIRTLVEIISFGKFDDFEDKRLYMRGFADKTLGPVYRNYGLSGKGVSYNMSCGLLKKEGQNYFIYDSGQPNQISKADSRAAIRALGKTYDQFEFYEDTSSSTYIVVTGDIPGKNNDWQVEFPKPSCKKITLSSDDILDYKNDINRYEKADLIEKLKRHSSGVPCFYTNWIDNLGRTRFVFGHTGMFRVPYTKTIGEHVPDELKVENYFDISEAIFGNEKDFVGRVFFEDAFCNNNNKSEILLGENNPQILSGPKPTTFQHYLTQPSEERDNLKHYGPDGNNKLSLLRGYKQYWHKEGENWVADFREVERYPNQYNTKINPVKSGINFTGRIRFENLSDVELGALLFALDLPYEKDNNGNIITECCHKIGMGKPLGLGSIRISPTLHLSNRKNRYSNIAEEWSIDLPESTSEGKTIANFKNSFATYILNALNGDTNKYTSDELWKVDRLDELKTMLDFNKKPDASKTKYMPLGSFRNRPVLPKPSDV